MKKGDKPFFNFQKSKKWYIGRMEKSVKQELKNMLARYSGGVDFDVLIPPSGDMGDYSTNIAFKTGGKPIDNANDLKKKLESDPEIKKMFEGITVLDPGFINFHLKDELLLGIIGEILSKKEKFGDLKIGDEKINLEFVSANPTGPPTVGNARAASFGDTLGNILKKTGHQVSKEYYINDVGVQVGKLAASIQLRMRQLKGEDVEFGEDLYRGEYVKEIAKEFTERSIPNEKIQDEAVKNMVAKARKTLESLGVTYDNWFSESKLHESGEVKAVLSELESKGHVAEEDGAKWLKINGDEKAVLVKRDGSTTYLMNDIAYTKNKFERGFDKAINIWGTDHHGDVPRLKAGVAALGYDEKKLEILLHQLVMLKQKDQKLKMSKRAGNLVLLEDLIRDVGKDAIRFFFLTKDLNTHMEFDVELAKEQSKKNPVFYIQYAFARLNSIFEKAGKDSEGADLARLDSEEEKILMRSLVKMPDIIESITNDYQVHHLANYALSLANQFHRFYEKHRVIQDDKELQKSRLALAQAVHIVFKECLGLMGISTPQRM